MLLADAASLQQLVEMRLYHAAQTNDVRGSGHQLWMKRAVIIRRGDAAPVQPRGQTLLRPRLRLMYGSHIQAQEVQMLGIKAAQRV